MSWIITRLGSWLWPVIAAAFAFLLAAFGVQTLRLDHEQTRFAEAQADYAQREAAAASAAESQSEAYRIEETRRTTAIQKETDETTVRNVQLAADAASASAAARSLQQRVATLATQARAASCHSEPSVGSPTAPDAAGMLAELQRRADERAGILAILADRRGSAGQLCEQAYDSLTNKAP